MEKKRWAHRVLRQLFNCIPASSLTEKSSWQWLRYYPAIIPSPLCFNEWNQADNEHSDYQLWIDQNSLSSLADWRVLKEHSHRWKNPPKISIVTPVHNTDAKVLYECILSVRAQAYPYWQLILVDDGSSSEVTHRLLKSGVCKDPRIKVYYCAEARGISSATNLAIERSQGDYVVFLDHDDRLSLDALYLLAEEISQYPGVDILYSDRDMISPEGKRYMHLFKPGWSPETLLAGNYIFHLMCYRRQLLQQLGGYRSELDGSQDYDLILRAIETQPQVRHIQKVLYHWRQYQGSVALDSNAKDYAFKAGVEALNQALQRRGIKGKASEIKSLWRGNYQLDLACADSQDIQVINIYAGLPVGSYTAFINQAVRNIDTPPAFIALLSDTLTPEKNNTIATLAAWLKIDDVGLASGSIITGDNNIKYTGATYQKNGGLLIPYQGYPISEAGYMAVTRLVRNISVPHPFCVVIRYKLWQQLKGLNTEYGGYYSLLDFALRAQAINRRCVIVPQAQFVCQQPNLLENFPQQDKQLFSRQWQDWLEQGDPYYNKNLDRNSEDKQFYINVIES
jgi:glycosyltransferase involved in cell wall biosynthesis